MNLMARRMALMGQVKPAGPIWIYNQGEETDLSGEFTTTGYKYGADSAFAQSKGSKYLILQATSHYNVRGGRTWTTSIPLPESMRGKTLRCTGTMSNPSGNSRSSFFRLYNAQTVIDISSTEDVNNSGAFVDAEYANFQFSGTAAQEVPAGTTKTFDLSLQLTTPGYVSVMFYKGYISTMVVHIDKIWVE